MALKLFVTSIMTAELDRRSARDSAEDQAPPQGFHRSQGRQEAAAATAASRS